MFCPSCGNQVLGTAQFCPFCGVPSAQPGTPPQGAPGAYPPPVPAPQGMPGAYPTPVPLPQHAPATAGPARVEAVPNYMTQSILVTLCCCLPFGIAAIVNSAKVNPLLQAGDYKGAQVASEAANKYAKYGVLGALVVAALQLLNVFLQAATHSRSFH